MGYVPPPVPVSVRRDLSPMLYELYMIFGGGIGKRSALPRTFAEYEERLYGPRGTDWMLALNYLLVGGVIALVGAIWLALS